MARRTLSAALGAVLLLVGLAGCGAVVPGQSTCGDLSTRGDTHDRATVEIRAPNGTVRATVDAMVADSPRERCVGLSDTATLGPNDGMVFVFAETATRTFVMRGMAFPLDMIFVAGNGTITTIHHAPVEEPPLTPYEGRAKWVLEVPRGWADRHGVRVGDRLNVTYRG
ncbi:MAG: DUF192 domain-containing protein [Halobacteriaceae archaeon]